MIGTAIGLSLAYKFLSGSSSSNEYLKNRQERKDSEWSPITTGAVAAAGLGVLASKKPFGKATANLINRTRYVLNRTLGKMSTIRDGADIDRYNLQDWKKLYKYAKSSWKMSKKDVEKGALKLSTRNRSGDNFSLLSQVYQVKALAANWRNEAKNRWIESRIVKPIKDQINKDFENGLLNKNEANSIQKFIENRSKNINNREAAIEELKRMKLSQNANSYALTSFQRMENMLISTTKKNGSQFDDSTFKASLEKIARESEKLLNAEALSRNSGVWDGKNHFGHHATTLGEWLDAVAKEAKKKNLSPQEVSDTLTIRDKNGKKTETFNAYEFFTDLLKDTKKTDKKLAEKLRNTYIDKENKFTDAITGEIFSKEGTTETYNDFLGFLRNTLPGQLLKVGDIDNARKIDAAQLITSTNDPVLFAKLRKIGEEDKVHYRLGKDIYTAAEDGTFSLTIDPETGESITKGMKLVSGRFGFFHTQIESLTGQTRTKISDNAFFRMFDLFQDRENYSGNVMGNLINKVFGTNERKAKLYGFLDNETYTSGQHAAASLELSVFYGNQNNLSDTTRTYTTDYVRSMKDIAKLFNEHTYNLSSDTIERISNNPLVNSESKRIWDLLKKDDNELIATLLDDKNGYTIDAMGMIDGKLKPIKTFINKDLEKLVTEYRSNPDIAYSKIELWSNEIGESYGTSLGDLFHSPMGNETAYFHDILRKQIEREAILRQGWNGQGKDIGWLNYNAINDLVDNVNIGEYSREKLNKLAQSAIFSHDSRMWQMKGKTTVNDIYNSSKEVMDYTQELFTGGLDYQKRVQSVYKDILESEVSSFEGSLEVDSAGAGVLNNSVFVNNSVSPLDLIKSLNESIKQSSIDPLSRDLSNIWNGLTASRDDMSGANLYTFVPHFTLKRLSDELNRVGLGFSSESTSSTGSLAMAFMTKRIMPLAIGATYLDWMDDTIREATGTGLWEGFVKGVANVDLTGRRIISGLGIDEWLKTEKDINPIWQYWGDKDEYQGYDERRKYYRDGYTPIRKAAWWTWGSVSEARGGEITYWQPNIVRRAESNYYDNSMYDGYFDKWSHSWLPTPTNPLSPLFAIADPYWLERKHSEDRPYPVSGPMFQEGTPWGAILNPTVGAILKPEKELHPYRLHNGIDIMALMRGINNSIKQWSDNWHRRNYIAINGSDISAVNLNMFDSPAYGSSILNITSHGGAISVYGGNAPGIYGTGGRDLNPASYGAQGYDANQLGNPVEMRGQDLVAGFNPIKDDRKAALHLLAGPEKMSAIDRMRESFWESGTKFVRNGEIVENANGELGIYQNRPLGPSRGSYFTTKQKLEMNIVTSNYGTSDKEMMLDIMNKYNPLDLIRDVNNATKQLSKQKVDNPYEIDEEAAFTSPAKLRSFKPNLTMDLLNNSDTVSDLMNTGKGSDFVRSAATSIRLIGGIYGYMGSEAIGLGVYNGPKIATSSDMTSFTRSFWDLNFGGLGGSVSEIGRRFIPNFQRANKLNPLLNNLPDWLPERFRYGDAYSSIPKGEMRLPGRGWESLNDYHSDIFSSEEDRTGAFDRFKILADIAPNSEEYKLWREIAKRTVTDPHLIEEMEEIKDRARQQGKKHDFYNYNVVGKSLNYENVIVSEVLGYGKFRSGSRIFKLAGVSVQGNAEENAQQVLNRYIHVGQEITIATDTNPYTGTNKDMQRTINAAVFVDGESVSKQMKEAGDARERKGDTSAPAKLADLTSMQQALGYMSEVVGHLDIPILSDQWLRIRSPYESYLAEQVYGTPYMSWSHPINTILKPAIDRAIYTRSITDLLINKAVFTDHGYRSVIPAFDKKIFGMHIKTPEVKLGRDIKHVAFMGRLLSNRASLTAYGVSNIIKSGDINLAHKFDRRFNEFVTVAHVLTGGRSMLDMAAMGAYLGDAAADFFSNPEAGKFKSKSKYMAIGAVAAMGYRVLKGQAGKSWIPENTQKKWEMEDYWDRLNYMKYMGLYEEAARRAEDEEDVDVKNALENIEEKEKERSFALEQLEKAREKLNEAYSFRTSPLKKHLLKLVNSRIRELDTDENIIEGGKYTQSAIIYKKAAESTMYGLKENASWSEIVTALPKNDRDYFMEFVSERDPEMRDKILETASPSLRRALLMAWGKKTEAPESNEEFFKHHYMPDEDWVGWRPDVDLNDVEVKTIENEAMNLSDFGFYESSLRTPGAQAAWGLPYNERNDKVNTARQIKKVLNGEGIKNVEVDVTEKNTMGPTDVVANIGVFLGLKDGKNKVDEALRAVEY